MRTRGIRQPEPRGPRPLASSLLTMALLGVAATGILVGDSAAVFTDDADGRGRPRAGSVDVVLNDDADDNVALTYEGPECGNLAHGESCSSPLTIANAGTLNATYNIRVVDSNNACWTSTLSTEKELEKAHRPPGDRVTGSLVSVLDNDASSCEGSTNRAVVVIRAAQSKEPHPG